MFLKIYPKWLAADIRGTNSACCTDSAYSNFVNFLVLSIDI